VRAHSCQVKEIFVIFEEVNTTKKAESLSYQKEEQRSSLAKKEYCLQAEGLVIFMVIIPFL